MNIKNGYIIFPFFSAQFKVGRYFLIVLSNREEKDACQIYFSTSSDVPVKDQRLLSFCISPQKD